jgi:proteasome lid subunit RPN8/RPN11
VKGSNVATLYMEPAFQEALWAHLLPEDDDREQGAFLFCAPEQTNGERVFQIRDSLFLGRNDFAKQANDYLELLDAKRVEVIKQAHALNASLVEFHSHPGPWPAAFSLADRRGLQETVPHMWWRLKGRPYLAAVVAPCSFDALIWQDNLHQPEPLTGIAVGNRLLTPTNASLGGWSHGHYESF